MTRAFTEPVDATSDRVIGPGVTIPELIKIYYPSAVPTGFVGKFGFLERDNKQRTYQPAVEDGFVFKGASSLKEFSDHAKHLIDVLNKQWTDLGFSLKHDDDRQIDIINSEEAFDALDSSHPLHQTLKNNLNAVYFIIANSDIMKKACIVRTVNAGWWCVSYRGKKSVDRNFFATSLAAHKRAFRDIITSAKGKHLYHKNWASASDPLDTNPGYPFFNATVDKDGNPVTRIQTIELFRNLQRANGFDWEKLIADVDVRAGKYGMEGFPFCVAALRRQQPGRKWQHQFNVTPSGMRTAFDEKGVNSQRVAWMVPYTYNLLLTPFQIAMKTIRMILPGLYHDGPSKLHRMSILRSQFKKGRLWLAEADYSNYDRFIPIDIMEEIIASIAQLTPNPAYWTEAAMYLHTDANLVWPDFTSLETGNGWLFKPGELGLMSGVKATSEAGTLVNSVVNGEVLARTYGWDEQRLYDYLTQYISSPTGTKTEYYYVQSDDTELIASDPANLKKQATLFRDAVKAAGLKGEVEIADRFLMRHMQAGCDRPVPARVWQNTLSNESSPPSEIIFLAGLASRTDGLLGIKTVDPFETGSLQAVSVQEAEFTTEMLKSLLHFVSTSAHKSESAVNLLSSFVKAGDYMCKELSGLTRTALPGHSLPLNNFRQNVARQLAREQQEMLKKLAESGSVAAWIYSLYKDRNIPSSSLMLDQLLELAPGLDSTIKAVMAKEEAFFKYASDTLGVKPLPL